jgi:hypothetical protein
LLQAPRLQFESPPELAAFQRQLEFIDQRRLADIQTLVGLRDAGAPVHIILATERSELARDVSPWVAGYAVGASGLVVIFPRRSPGYPDNTLEDVLRHELTHIFIWRAAAGYPIPRWFNEGLAMAAERERRFQDQTELLYQLVAGSRTTLPELDRLFSGGQNDQIRAYALAGAIVHDVQQRYGADACARILMRVSQGAAFDAAFHFVTGVPPDTMESEFWGRQRIWTTWIPILGSTTTLWLAVTLLALLAIRSRRRRNREIEKRWEDEDGDDLQN